MAATDFTTVLGRLLTDGRLRDNFVVDAPTFLTRMEVNLVDREQLLELPAGELEYQAQVLLHKRFVQVRECVPETCRRMGAQAWPLFAAYSRMVPPTNRLTDIVGFLDSLPAMGVMSELNRFRFVMDQRLIRLHIVRELGGRRQNFPAVQLLWRTATGWREWTLSFGL